MSAIAQFQISERNLSVVNVQLNIVFMMHSEFICTNVQCTRCIGFMRWCSGLLQVVKTNIGFESLQQPATLEEQQANIERQIPGISTNLVAWTNWVQRIRSC